LKKKLTENADAYIGQKKGKNGFLIYINLPFPLFKAFPRPFYPFFLVFQVVTLICLRGQPIKPTS